MDYLVSDKTIDVSASARVLSGLYDWFWRRMMHYVTQNFAALGVIFFAVQFNY